MKAAVSIIMPVYLTEAYVKEAIESVQAQTFSDWELLIVDDGSPDGSYAVWEEAAARDPRIRLFRQENGGVSRARNRALREAEGSYYCFLDSDDTLDPLFLERLLKRAEQVPDGAACCGFLELKGEEARASSLPAAAPVLDTDEFLYEILMGTLSLPLCCANWLMPAEKCRDLRFEEGLRYSEDSLFAASLLARCRQVSYDPEPLYRYRIGREGNTVTRDGLDKQIQTFAAWEKIRALFAGREGKAPQVLTKRLVEIGCAAVRRAKEEKRRPEAALYRKKAWSCWKELKKGNAVSAGDKRRLLFYVLCPRLSEKLMLRLYGRV